MIYFGQNELSKFAGTLMRRSHLVSTAMIVFASVSTLALLNDEMVRYFTLKPQQVGMHVVDRGRIRSLISQEETLGFITDLNHPDAVERALRATAYSVAPYIVENSVHHRFLLGAFRNQSSVRLLLLQHHLRIIEDLGGGFLILGAQ